MAILGPKLSKKPKCSISVVVLNHALVYRLLFGVTVLVLTFKLLTLWQITNV